MDSNNKTIIQTTPADIGTPQPILVRKLYDDAIYNKGYNASIERALQCPCKVKGSDSPLSSCMNCGGSGWVFIDKQSTKLLCQSMANRTKYTIWTSENTGTVNITARPEDRLGFMDRVTINDLLIIWPESLVLRKSTSNVFFAFTIYQPIQILDVYFFAGDSVELVYIPPANYSFDNNKIIINSIPGYDITTIQNPRITVRYMCSPTYYVIDINRDIIKQPSGDDCMTLETHYDNFPVNCIGRRAHLVLDAPNFNGLRLFDNTNYSRTPINYDY